KGGVGKTTACVNLAYLAAKEGAQTILCDLDPQASASYYFRIRPAKKFGAKRLLKGGKNIVDNIRGTDYHNLDLLPSKLSFRNLDVALDALKHSKTRLKEIIGPLDALYDFVFLDCPANISRMSENVFVAADAILVPLIPTTLSVQAYETLMKFMKKQNLDSSRVFAFFSMVEKRKKLHNHIVETGINGWEHCLSSRIPYAADVEKMGLYREPVASFRPRSPATGAYRKLWKEVRHLDRIADSEI
ncbi:AAA family ATPase, partial [bacterium]|nr:AAA family ATPase [bacterium]